MAPSLGDGDAEISLTVHRDPQGPRFELQTWSCQGGGGGRPTLSELLLLIDAAEEGARVATSLRETPADRGTGPFSAAALGQRPVRRWSHAWIWFADSTDAAEWQLAGRARTRTFVARRDGRVEHAGLTARRDSLVLLGELEPYREAYPPRGRAAPAPADRLHARPRGDGGHLSRTPAHQAA